MDGRVGSSAGGGTAGTDQHELPLLPASSDLISLSLSISISPSLFIHELLIKPRQRSPGTDFEIGSGFREWKYRVDLLTCCAILVVSADSSGHYSAFLPSFHLQPTLANWRASSSMSRTISSSSARPLPSAKSAAVITAKLDVDDLRWQKRRAECMQRSEEYPDRDGTGWFLPMPVGSLIEYQYCEGQTAAEAKRNLVTEDEMSRMLQHADRCTPSACAGKLLKSWSAQNTLCWVSEGIHSGVGRDGKHGKFITVDVRPRDRAKLSKHARESTWQVQLMLRPADRQSNDASAKAATLKYTIAHCSELPLHATTALSTNKVKGRSTSLESFVRSLLLVISLTAFPCCLLADFRRNCCAWGWCCKLFQQCRGAR